MDSEKIKEIKELLQSCYDFLEDLKTIIKQKNARISELEKENAEQLKQFAERLKEISCEMYLKEQLHRCIDETLKECLDGKV
ncbi:MAG: hypothetical protein IKW45_06560 [Clostridia bacterium]|nr:hypothetical protein [Clostridia bacterium]